jgi:hypothetical protein
VVARAVESSQLVGYFARIRAELNVVGVPFDGDQLARDVLQRAAHLVEHLPPGLAQLGAARVEQHLLHHREPQLSLSRLMVT